MQAGRLSAVMSDADKRFPWSASLRHAAEVNPRHETDADLLGAARASDISYRHDRASTIDLVTQIAQLCMDPGLADYQAATTHSGGDARVTARPSGHPL